MMKNEFPLFISLIHSLFVSSFPFQKKNENENQVNTVSRKKEKKSGSAMHFFHSSAFIHNNEINTQVPIGTTTKTTEKIAA